jgi:hypothetical protein
VVQTYSDVIERQNLRTKIDLAKRLGFHDDVAHWTNELNNLINKEEA